MSHALCVYTRDPTTQITHFRCSLATPSHTLLSGLRLDPNFRPLLEKASEEVRRRVISIFTHGGGYVAGGDAAKASPDPGKGVTGASDAASEAGLASVVEVQEREICSLKKEIFEAVSRLPRDGGVTALEESLGDQVLIFVCRFVFRRKTRQDGRPWELVMRFSISGDQASGRCRGTFTVWLLRSLGLAGKSAALFCCFFMIEPLGAEFSAGILTYSVLRVVPQTFKPVDGRVFWWVSDAQVKELEETVSANSKEIGKLGAELSEALGQVSDEKQRYCTLREQVFLRQLFEPVLLVIS